MQRFYKSDFVRFFASILIVAMLNLSLNSCEDQAPNTPVNPVPNSVTVDSKGHAIIYSDDNGQSTIINSSSQEISLTTVDSNQKAISQLKIEHYESNNNTIIKITDPDDRYSPFMFIGNLNQLDNTNYQKDKNGNEFYIQKTNELITLTIIFVAATIFSTAYAGYRAAESFKEMKEFWSTDYISNEYGEGVIKTSDQIAEHLINKVNYYVSLGVVATNLLTLGTASTVTTGLQALNSVRGIAATFVSEFLVSWLLNNRGDIFGDIHGDTKFLVREAEFNAETEEGHSVVWGLDIVACYGDNVPQEEPILEYPQENAVNIPTSFTFQWECSDYENDPIIYDLYLGNNPSPTLLAGDLPNLHFQISGLNAGTKYYWKVVAEDSHGNISESIVQSFTTENSNQPPSEPSNPDPENNEQNVDPVDLTIFWNFSTDPDGDQVSYDVFFGTTTNPPQVFTGTPYSRYLAGDLSEGTTYYWKVKAKDGNGGETFGDLWSFTTSGGNNLPPSEPLNPYPQNNATNVDADGVDLFWDDCTDPDGDQVSYDVYFGTSSNPPLKITNILNNSYETGTLSNNSTYYWKIAAKDGNGGVTFSQIWEFKTENDDPSPVEGLLAYYPFNGNADDEYGDHNGIINGPVLTSDRFSNPNSAYLFDGDDDYIDIGNQLKPSLPISISCWIRASEINNMVIFRNDKVDGNTTYNGVIVTVTESGQLSSLIGNGQIASPWSRYDMHTVNSVINANQWMHVVVVFNSPRDQKYYVNGEFKESEAGTGTASTMKYSNNNGAIGARYPLSSNRSVFNGKIDDIRVFNKALTLDEIRLLFNE